MTSKHTPGPWFHSCDEGAAYGCNVNVADGVIADMTDDDEGDTALFNAREANARLIAAAPDLLAVCQAIAERYNVEDRLGGIGDWLNDTIAKAVGE